MSAFSTNPKEGLLQFFNLVWGSVEGYVYLPVKSRENTWRKVYFEWPKHRDYVVSHVLQSSAAGNDVFFSPVLWNKPEVSKNAIQGSHVVWADFDGSAPDDWATLPPKAIGSASVPVPGPPSVEVQSSTEDHRHVYWRLDTFSQNIEELEGTNRAIAYAFGADTSGWDAEQILRPPYTTNYKHDLPVLVASFDQTVYDSSQFICYKPAVKELVRESIDTDNLPGVEIVLGKYIIEPDTLDLMQKESVPEGSRSSAMMRVAFHCAELGMTDSEAYAVMLWLDDKWGKFKSRNDRVKRLLDLVNKARQKFPHKVEDPTFDGLRKDTAAVAVDFRVWYGFTDFLNQDLRVEWEVQDLIAQGGIGVIISPPGLGKTQLLMNMGMKFALGEDFIGWHPLKAHKSLLLELEMGAHHSHRFITTMAQAYDVDQLSTLQQNYIISPLGESVPLHKPEGRRFLESLLDELQPTGVYIDSLGEIIADLQDDKSVRSFFSYLRTLRNKYKCYFFIIHHPRKSQDGSKKPKSLDDVFGSQYITSSSDFVLLAWKHQLGMEIITLKNRLAEERQPFIVKRVENLQFMAVSEMDTFDGLHNSADKSSLANRTGLKSL